MKYKIYSGTYQVPYFEYCTTCEDHHLRWKMKRWEYKDKTVVNERLLIKEINPQSSYHNNHIA